MRKILFILVVAGVFMACGTKYDYIDTGVCGEEFRGNMYEYLQSNHYDWDSIVKIIDRAGLREMFERILLFWAPRISLFSNGLSGIRLVEWETRIKNTWFMVTKVYNGYRSRYAGKSC